MDRGICRTLQSGSPSHSDAEGGAEGEGALLSHLVHQEMAHHRIDLEYSLLKVPCETLGAHFQKQRKLVGRAVGSEEVIVPMLKKNVGTRVCLSAVRTQVTKELGQVVTQFVDSDGNPAVPAGSVRDVPAMVARLKELRRAVVEAEEAERAILERCQQASSSSAHPHTLDCCGGVVGGLTIGSVCWGCRSCRCWRPNRSSFRVTSGGHRSTTAASGSSSGWWV